MSDKRGINVSVEIHPMKYAEPMNATFDDEAQARSSLPTQLLKLSGNSMFGVYPVTVESKQNSSGLQTFYSEPLPS